MMHLIHMRRVGLLSLGVTIGLACAGVSGNSSHASHAATVALHDTIQTLTFAWGAANLALQSPYDTVQLEAIPRTVAGAVVHNAGPVSYTTPDSAITVSATGVVTARRLTPAAHVIASVMQDGITFADTAIIQVTAAPLPSPLATLSIQPQEHWLRGIPVGDGLWLTRAQANLHTELTVPFFATLATGNPATDTLCRGNSRCTQYPLVVRFMSSDPNVAFIIERWPASGWWSDVALAPVKPGRVTFTVSTIAYGVHKIDSLPLSIGYSQGAIADLYTDTSHHPPVLARQPRGRFVGGDFLPPYSVGLHLHLNNTSGQPVEVILPPSAHFMDVEEMQTLPKTLDTLAENAQWMSAKATVRLDSAGTYILRYRGVKTGTVLSDTLTALPYP